MEGAVISFLKKRRQSYRRELNSGKGSRDCGREKTAILMKEVRIGRVNYWDEFISRS